MAANVRKIKAKHAEQEKYWQTIESRHTEAVGVLQAQVQELLERQKMVLQAKVEAVKGRETTLKDRTRTLTTKLKGKYLIPLVFVLIVFALKLTDPFMHFFFLMQLKPLRRIDFNRT